MLDLTIEGTGSVCWIRVKGRIDGMTAPELEKTMEALITEGARMIVADLHAVDYVSSAGLRSFLTVQKRLKGAGGQIVMYRIAGAAEEVFALSGFKRLFFFASTESEIESLLRDNAAPAAVRRLKKGDLSFECMELKGEPSNISVIASWDGFESANYDEADVVTVKAGDIRFGTGLATLGTNYQAYRPFFGEAVVIANSLFFYPAVKQPAVDFMLCPKEPLGLSYQFLHGFAFSGSFRYVLSFDGANGPVSLPDLVRACLHVSSANSIGIVLLGESRGLWGMHLKQVPTVENKPQNGKGLLDPSNFATWFNFPVEPTDFNAVVAAVGVAARNPEALSPRERQVLPGESAIHFHGAVFSKSPLSRRIEHFENELDRVLRELEPVKVQHLTGRTQFGNCLAAVVELAKEA